MILNTSGKLVANYWLEHVYPAEVRDAHLSGAMHIHDLDMFSGYCAGWSLRQLLQEGFNGVPGKVESDPPKHFETALGQMVNFLGTLQNEWAGAQAFSSFDTLLAPMSRADGLDLAHVTQAIQQFVFNLNVPSRWGTQTPFTNITLDWTCPEDLRMQRPVIAGVTQPFTYGDCRAEMALINRAFIDVMTRGDLQRPHLHLPHPHLQRHPRFSTGTLRGPTALRDGREIRHPLLPESVNSALDPKDVRSMCCRLQLDLRQLRERGGGLFGSAEMTGSVGVVTINLAQIGYLAKTEASFLERLGRLMELAKASLEMKRAVVQENIDRGLLPYTRRYLGTLRHHFSTIGLNGMNKPA